ncbi:hypothetical protein scyTo_0013455, partial [Scyliorhinus torazame]|nr:hypothetical protein [Scyliorhinus torazame]
TAVGSCLANKLGWKFYDADDYHPKENKEKMVKGIPLDDEGKIIWSKYDPGMLFSEENVSKNPDL